MPTRAARPGRRAPIATLLLAAVLAASSLVAAPALPAAAADPIAPLAPGQSNTGLGREVFGYLPYWEIDAGIESYLRYDLLTTIAFFGIDLRSDGTIDTSKSGYLRYVGDTAGRIIAAAHAAGVRTVVTLQSFGYSKNAAFFTNPGAQATAIAQLVGLMTRRGADGINVDVELMSSTYLAGYGAFIANLRAAVLAANPNAQVTVATGADAWGARMAQVAVANGADRAVIMGYDYRWSGSRSAGAVAPILRADGGQSLTRTLDTYAAYVPADRLILALPYYGRSWPTVSDALNAPVQTDTATYGGSVAFFPKSLPDGAKGALPAYDDPELSVRLVRFDPVRGTWIQTHYDDPSTLAPKVALTNVRGLAGLGIWALGYDRGQPGYWDVIANAYGAPRITSLQVLDGTSPPFIGTSVLAPPASPPPGYSRSPSVLVAATWTEGPVPATAIRLSNDGVAWSDWLPIGSAVPWTLAAGTDGTRRVHAQLLGGAAALSKVVAVRAILDSTPPSVSVPSVRVLDRTTFTAPVAGLRLAWKASEGTTSVGGVGLEVSVDGGDWTPVELPGPLATSVAIPVELGRVYRFRASAHDLVGNVSEPAATADLTVASVDDRSSVVKRSAGWSRTAAGTSHAGTLTSTSLRGAVASYTFTGRSIAIVGPVGPRRGAATVTIDGRAAGSFTAYAAGNGSRRVLYVRELVPGRHTIRIVTAGTAGHPRVDLDAFVVVR